MKSLAVLTSIVTVSLVFLLFTPNISQATTYHVDKNHPSASDANPGTEDLPWLTIQHAAETMIAGDTVLIRNGVYNEQVFTVCDGNATGYIVFSAYPGETPIIDGTGVTTGNNGFIVAHSYIKLAGLEIRNWNDNGIWMDNAGYIEISDCVVHDVVYGIGAVNGTHDFVLNRVEMHNFDLYGFDASPSYGIDCYNGTFNDCIAHTGRDSQQNVDGFALGHGTQHDFVFNRCKVYEIYDGFDISARNTTLNRCLAHDCWNGGYKLWQDNVKLVNCIGYNNSRSNVELDWDGEPGVTTLINCTFFDAQTYTIWVENSADTLRMHNCILAGGDNIGLAFEQMGVSNYHGDYNIFHNDNGRAIAVAYTDEFTLEEVEDGDWTTYSGQDAHSLVVYSDTELFVNPAGFDLNILQTSLAVDNGTSDGAPLEDYEGKPRPQGNGYDIGAYEYGEPVPGPRISVSPLSYDFGSVDVGRTSASQSFTIENVGDLDLTISSIVLSDTTNYSLDLNGGSTPCGSTPTLTPGSSCAVSVIFNPSSLGTLDARLTINSNDSYNPTVRIPLTGVGERPTGDLSGDLKITAYDASLILQYVVGIIDRFPVEDMTSPSMIMPQNYIVKTPVQTAKVGDMIHVPVSIDNATGLLAGGISLKYDPTILKAINVTSQTLFLNGAYSVANVSKQGEVRFAFATTEMMNGQGDLFIVEFEVLPDTEGETSALVLDQIDLSNSLKIAKNNGSLTVLPLESVLLQNYPNPFNPETWIPFRLAEPTGVNVTIYDIHGRLIRKFGLGRIPAGIYISQDRAVYWDGRNQTREEVSSGIYFYTLQTDGYSATKKMLISK